MPKSEQARRFSPAVVTFQDMGSVFLHRLLGQGKRHYFFLFAWRGPRCSVSHSEGICLLPEQPLELIHRIAVLLP